MRCLLIRNKEHGLAYISIRRGNAPSKRGGIYEPKRVDKNNCHNRGSDHRGCDWLSCRTLYSGICVGSSSSNLYCGSVGFGLAEFDEIGNCCSSFVVFFANKHRYAWWTLALAQSCAGYISRRRRDDRVAHRSVRCGMLVQRCLCCAVIEDV